MPQSPAVPNFYAPPNSTMSLAVLPSSPLTYDPTSIPTLLPPGPPSSKRPKLSLNTASAAPIFGKNATSLRLETLSATSPTSRNTFRNAHDAQRRNTVNRTKLALTPLATGVLPVTKSIPAVTQAEPVAETIESVVKPSQPAIATFDSTINDMPFEAPYKLPTNAVSILTNGPIPRVKGRQALFSQTCPVFSATKKVLFRAQLTEDIETTKFTMRHPDIEVVPTGVTDGGDEQQRTETQDNCEAGEPSTSHSPRSGEKRDSSDEESDTCPATPVAGRRKRDRQWRWTLGHVSPASPPKPRQANDSVMDEESESACISMA